MLSQAATWNNDQVVGIRRMGQPNALGLTNIEIARSLSISIEPVKEHVQNILRKLAMTDRT